MIPSVPFSLPPSRHRGRRGALRALAGAAVLAAAGIGTATAAEPYPDRPVTVVVPYAAGGATDLVARILTRALATHGGRPFVVQNVAGAAATLGAARVAAAAADGYTLLLAGAGSLVVAPHLYPALKYDTFRAFEPIGKVATSAYVLMARAGAGLDSYEQLVSRARAEPNRFSYGTPGVGSGLHLTIELMLEGSRFTALHVPFSGIAPAWNALLGGTVDFLIDSPSGVLPQIKAGRAVALAVTSAERVPELPNVPTLREKGLKGFESMAWFGVLAPKGTPAPVVARLRELLAASLKDPEVVAGFKTAGFGIPDEALTAFGDTLTREYARWGTVIAEHHIRIDR